MVGDVAEKVADKVADQVGFQIQKSLWSKFGTFFKENWMSLLGTVFGGSTSSAALSKANRLFEVLSIDNISEEPGEENLYYIKIS